MNPVVPVSLLVTLGPWTVPSGALAPAADGVEGKDAASQPGGTR